MILLLGLALSASAVDGAASFDLQARAACSAPVGARPKLPGIAVQAFPASGGDYAYLRISDRESGGWMKAYFDPVSEPGAWARAACLGAQIRLISREIAGAWPKARWFSVTFTADPDYVSPVEAGEGRWTVPTRPDGSLGERGQNMVILTMPHEQLHSFQKRAGARLPRWLEEGHAEWVSRKVKARLAPVVAEADARHYAEALAASTAPVALAGWGGISVTRAAILRQASPDERKKMEADPSYRPPGPYRFGPGDLTSDESNSAARYEAATRMFDTLARTYGTSKVREWVSELTAASGKITAERIDASAVRAFGRAVSPLLEDSAP